MVRIRTGPSGGAGFSCPQPRGTARNRAARAESKPAIIPSGMSSRLDSFLVVSAPCHEKKDSDEHQHRTGDLEKGPEACVHGVKLRIHAWLAADDSESDQEAEDAHQEG